MSKLDLRSKVPAEYSKPVFADIISAICLQANALAEGQLVGRYQARASVPSSVSASVGDIVWDSNTTVRGSVAPGLSASYVRLGWVCTAGDVTNPTWQEIRVLTGS